MVKKRKPSKDEIISFLCTELNVNGDASTKISSLDLGGLDDMIICGLAEFSYGVMLSEGLFERNKTLGDVADEILNCF